MIDQKFACEEVCTYLLTRYVEKRDELLKLIFTIDKMWVHLYVPECGWTNDEKGLLEAKVEKQAGKVMCTIFWDNESCTVHQLQVSRGEGKEHG